MAIENNCTPDLPEARREVKPKGGRPAKAEEEKKKLEEETKSIEEEDNDDTPGKLKGFGSKIGKFIQKLISEYD